jgi:hypothetical protein
MAEVVKLATPPTADEASRRSAVELLEGALADAKAGKVLECIIITKETDRSWLHRSTPFTSTREMIGAIESMKWDILERNNGKVVEEK